MPTGLPLGEAGLRCVCVLLQSLEEKWLGAVWALSASQPRLTRLLVVAVLLLLFPLVAHL